MVFLILACHRQSAESAAVSHAPGQFGDAAITGRVIFRGTPPPPSPMAAAKLSFPDCARFPGGAADPGLILKDGAVRDAFVWIREGISGDYPVPQAPVVLDQRGCEFVPRVFGIRPGQPIVLTSSDDFLHNVHADTAFNVPMPRAGERAVEKFERTGVMRPIKCDVHNWMRAFAGVVPHPFWAVTGDDGRFAIPKLPAGTYTLEIWQERLGWRRMDIKLAGNETREVSIDYTRAP